MPVFAGGIVITLHVVSALGRTYGQAGVVAAAATLAIAVSGPWRGRLLDRKGLRRVVAPSVVVTAACWSVAPFVGYWWLLGLATLAGLFVIPSFSIIRQAVIAAVPEQDRRTAISLDAVAVELSFMTGPALAVWAAATWRTDLVLLAVQAAGVLAGVLLWVANPVLREDVDPGEQPQAPPPRSAWLRPGFVVVCLGAAATTLVLAGTDLGVVAALRDLGQPGAIGPVLAVWGLGSLVGGLVYGGMHRSVSAFWLLGGLAVTTAPLALAGGAWTLGGLALVAGLFCAPTITATIDQVSRAVPASARGEAMGWHGSSMTAGAALGAPLTGFVIDHSGWGAGFVVVAAAGVLVALVGSVVTSGAARGRRAARASRSMPAPAHEPVASGRSVP
ncbi:MFS transporter [Arthrobacter sp. NEB 688]|nr:MFS transporter [Arthrobacter sp. NEB 688]